MRKRLFVIMVIIFTVFMGCNKENNPSNDNENIDGFYYCVVDENDNSDNSTMRIYKGNHLLYEIPKEAFTGNFSFCHKIVVKGDALYATIKEKDPSNNTMSVWKNGQNLYNFSAIIESLCIDGNNIISTGRSGNTSEGYVWKNSELLYTLELPDSTKYLRTYMSVMAGNDVYVAGMYCCGNSDNNHYAAVWKNGTLFFQTDGWPWDSMYGIGYHNGNLYYYGREGNPPHAKIWKNGKIEVEDGSEINDVIIYNNDVYAVGCGGDNNHHGSVGIVWKNGVRLYEIVDDLPESTNYDETSSSVELYSINIIDGDVYVSGRVDWVPKIWKNGTEYQGISEGIYGPEKKVFLLKNGLEYQDQL